MEICRLIRAQRPMPDDPNPLALTRFRTERYFLDGVRRVQEVITEDLPVIVIGNPILMDSEAETTGEPQPDPDGILVSIPRSLHSDFHGKLLSALAENGIKLSGKKGDTWGEYFKDNPKNSGKAIGILKDITQQFDKDKGTDLTSLLVAQLARQGK